MSEPTTNNAPGSKDPGKLPSGDVGGFFSWFRELDSDVQTMLGSFPLILGALLVRLVNLNERPRTYPEAINVIAAVKGRHLDLAFEPVAGLQAEFFRLLYNLTGSTAWMRLTMVVLGCWLVLSVFRFGTRLHSPWVGFLTGAFVAFSPSMVLASREIQPATPVALLMMLSLGTALELILRQNRLTKGEGETENDGNNGGFNVQAITITVWLTLLIGMSAYGILWALPAVLLVAIWSEDARSRLAVLMQLLPGIALGSLAWWAYRAEWINHWSVEPPWPPQGASAAWQQVLVALTSPWLAESMGLLQAVLMTVLAVAGLLTMRTTPKTRNFLLAWLIALAVPTLLLGPPALSSAPSEAVVLQLPLWTLVATVIMRLEMMVFRSVLLTVLALLFALGLQTPTAANIVGNSEAVSQLAPQEKLPKNYLEAATYIANKLRPNDVIGHSCVESTEVFQCLFNHEFSGRKVQFTFDMHDAMRDEFYGKYTTETEHPPDGVKFWGRIVNANHITHRFHRIWLVRSWWGREESNRQQDRFAQLDGWLREHYRFVETRDFAGCTVSLYVVQNVMPSTDALNWKDRPALLQTEEDYLRLLD